MSLIKQFANKSDEAKIEELKDEIRPFLGAYLKEHGINPESGGLYFCIDKEHHFEMTGKYNTNSPAMGELPGGNALHCFSCNTVVDIFKAANILEGKPLHGIEFRNENIFYLAKKYNIPYEHLVREATFEEIEREKKYTLFRLIADYLNKNKNWDYLNQRNISLETTKNVIVGTVKSFDDLKNYVLKYGVEESLLEECGVKRSTVNENKLTFIIENDYGKPVSYVSREMVYTEKNFFSKYPWKEEYERRKVDGVEENVRERVERIAQDLSINSNEIMKYFDTFKYVNGKGNDIYNKSKLFFLWSKIKKKFQEHQTLYIVEGYIDAVSAYQNGITNVVALGSASWTDEHFTWVEYNPKVKKVVIALDRDRVGQRRMEKILEKIKSGTLTKKYYFGENIGDGKDLDEMLQNKPTKNVSELIKSLSMFEFELKQLKENEIFDEDIVFDKFTRIIANEEEPREREKQAKELSHYIGYNLATIIDQIDYIKNGREKKVVKEIEFAIEEAKKAISKNPKDAISIIDDVKLLAEETLTKADMKRKDWFEKCRENISGFEEEMLDKSNFEIKFGLEAVDKLNIVPGDFIVLTAKSHIGKSYVYLNTAINTLANNHNTTVFYCTTDDPAKMLWAKMIAILSGLPYNYCKQPYYDYEYGLMSSNNPHKEVIFERYIKAKTKIEEWVNDKRFVILGVKDGIGNYDVFASTVKSICQTVEKDNRIKVMFVDSVNKLEVDGLSDSERSGFLSEKIKKISESYDLITFANFELNKTEQNEKATTGKLSGSRRIYLDATSMIFLHQPKHELGEESAETVWYQKIGGGFQKAPVLVMEVIKSKQSMNRDTHFLKLEMLNGRIGDVSMKSQEHEEFKYTWRSDEMKYSKGNSYSRNK